MKSPLGRLTAVFAIVTFTAGCLQITNGRISRAEIRSVCKLQQDCDPSSFDDEYSSVADCVADVEDDLDDDLGVAEDISEGCADAFEAALECALKAAECNESLNVVLFDEDEVEDCIDQRDIDQNACQ